MNKAKQLYDKLRQTHPDYKIWSGEWQRYSDIIGDKEPFNKARYLPRSQKENKKLYDLRVLLAEFVPDSTLAIDKLIGALFKENPKRELPKCLDSFVDDVTMNGDNINEYMKEVAAKYMAYGCIRELTNSNKPDGSMTVKEEQEHNIRPYMIHYTPDQVIDWDTDTYGGLSMVRIFEQDSIWNGKTFEHEVVHKFIEYTQDTMRWWSFKQGKNGEWAIIPKMSQEKPQDHGLGEVPMTVHSLKAIKPMIGLSFIHYSSLADVQKFRAESDMIYDAYIHSHPTLKVWTARDMRSIGVGSNTFCKLKPESGEDMKYVDVPSSAFEALQAIANDRRDSVYRQAKTDPLGILHYSPLQASGVARAWSFGTSEARLLADLAGKMEDIERSFFTKALKYMGKEDEADKINIQYPTEFDMSSMTQLIDDTEKITEQVNSPTLIRVLHKRIAAAKAGNISAEMTTTIIDEIDNGPLKSEMMPEVPAPEELGMPFVAEDGVDVE